MSLKNCRENANMNITKVANLLGVDRRTYYLWESQGKDIPSSMLVKLANIFHCTLNDLLDFFPDDEISESEFLKKIKNNADNISDMIEQITKNNQRKS